MRPVSQVFVASDPVVPAAFANPEVASMTFEYEVWKILVTPFAFEGASDVVPASVSALMVRTQVGCCFLHNGSTVDSVGIRLPAVCDFYCSCVQTSLVPLRTNARLP